jgi:hypothetical protein
MGFSYVGQDLVYAPVYVDPRGRIEVYEPEGLWPVEDWVDVARVVPCDWSEGEDEAHFGPIFAQLEKQLQRAVEWHEKHMKQVD